MQESKDFLYPYRSIYYSEKRREESQEGIFYSKTMSYFWTEEQRDTIREVFDQSFKSVEALAVRFGVTPNAVSQIISRMGLRPLRRRWSVAEEIRLGELLSEHTIDDTVRLMKRSYNSIVIKAKRLGIGKNNRDGWYTEQDVAEIFGMASRTVQGRIRDGVLIAAPHDSTRLPRKGKSSPWHISKNNLVDYIRKYPEDLVGRNVDIIVIVDLLGGLKSPCHREN